MASAFASSTTVIGALIGLEGLMALALPILVGSWSDRLSTSIGGRLPFVFGATPTLVLALALLGFVGSIGAAGFALAIFFASYFVAYEPYRALYPDLVGDDIAGRAQSTQALARGIGTVLALVAGGPLISVGKPVPHQQDARDVGLELGADRRRGGADRPRGLTGERQARRSLRPHASHDLGPRRLRRTALRPVVTTNIALLIVDIPFVAFGGGVIMTLPYALLMPMMPEDEHGALTGFYSVSRGLGVALGPALGGVAIQVAGSNYQAMWLVCGAAILASIPFMKPLRAREARDAGD